MRWAVVVCLVACSYKAPSEMGDDTPVIDASVGEDAPTDGRPARCDLDTSGGSVDRGKVGLGGGGAPQTPITCGEGTVLVGIAIDLSDGLADGVTQSALGIKIACAPVSIVGTAAQLGTVSNKVASGNGGNGWSPSTMSQTAFCPPGAVVTGMSVFGSQFMSYFLDATIRCTQYDGTGTATGSTTVDIVGSGSSTLNPSQAQCNAGEQVVAIVPNTGAGLDSVRLQCATTSCD